MTGGGSSAAGHPLFLEGSSLNYLKNKTVQDGVVVLALGLALGTFSVYSFFHSKVKAAWIMSPYLFPMLIACFAVGLGFCLLLEGKHQMDPEAGSNAPAPKTSIQLKPVLRVVEMSAAYCFLLPILTFIPTTALFLFALMSFMGENRWKVRLPLAVLTPLALYAIFALGLNVRLP